MAIILINGKTDEQEVELSFQVLRRCVALMPRGFFRVAKLLTPLCPGERISRLGDTRFEWVRIPAMDYEDFNIFSAVRTHEYVENDIEHVMQVEPDGFIVNPHLWEDSWLETDMIGAPWPAPMVQVGDRQRNRVGNSGFMIRSRRFLEQLAQLPAPTVPCRTDVWMCQENRPELEKLGMSFATLEQAARFSLEHAIPEFPHRTLETVFGQHARLNANSLA